MFSGTIPDQLLTEGLDSLIRPPIRLKIPIGRSDEVIKD